MRKLYLLFVALVLVAFISVIAGDLGDAGNQTSGAGDIWWLDSIDLVNAYERVSSIGN